MVMNEENIRVVEAYLDALRQQDLSLAPLADDVLFENPMVGKGKGAESFKAFLSGFLPAIKGVKLIGHISDGDTVATRWEVDSVFGIIRIADFFIIRDGKIVEAHGYFDPRPLFG
jgi:limonene-1,2-epoxide hydrolase